MCSSTLRIETVDASRAAEVYAVTRAAFSARPTLDPPADADSDSEATIAAALGRGRGLLATVDGNAVGALLLDPQGKRLFLRRVGVLPQAQEHGVARAMVDKVVSEAVGFDEIVVLARLELPGPIEFWQSLGFAPGAQTAPYLELSRPLERVRTAADAQQMRQLGERLGRLLEPGELLVLSGDLGAGKTTFTQGLGRGLRVRGDVTSPTFVIARVHPSLADGPDLVHVDAYRLGGIAELDDLDLDASLEESVTVVEWGEGLAEGLADQRLEIHLERAMGDEASDPADDLDPRTVRFDRRP